MTRITAGQLRAQGAIIDANIPDRAWVPSDSIRLAPAPGAKGEWTKTSEGQDEYRTTTIATFMVPFTWEE